MKLRMKNSLLVVLYLLIAEVSYEQNCVKYVDPFIGTSGHGHTYPGATVPFGMVQLSPDNGTQGWDWCSGYHYSDTMIAGFSHTHLSGTGIGDLADISVMPAVNEKVDTGRLVSGFSHSSETASPGYYSVKLNKYKIKAELTAGEYYGVHRYTFPASNNASIRFDLGFAINWDKTVESYFKQIDDSTFVGYRYSTGWAKNQRVYFAARLNKPVKKTTILKDGAEVNKEAGGTKVMAWLEFPAKENEKVELTVVLSFANIEGAMAALKQASGNGFEQTRTIATRLWNSELSKIQITSKDEKQKKIFYTSLYHAFLAPTVFSDVNGNYKGANNTVEHSDETVFSTHSLWDVFRAQMPLFTIVQKQRLSKIINSYLLFYKQHGLLPVWDLSFNEANTMTGYHAVPIIADGILKGIGGFDTDLAYEAMKKSAMQNIRGTDLYRQYGYIPQDKYGSSVTITLEYSFDDWCIASVAKKMGRQSDYEYFLKRSESWKNLFDGTLGFARAKDSKGAWVQPFDPFYSEHDVDKAMFTEGNAWQHTWFVPHDINGLMGAFGGNKKMIKKLDSLFTAPVQMTGENVSPDISGMIGQYAQGNEPDHHVAYLYSLAGEKTKTAQRVDQILNELYTEKTDGLCGNEDCGQMSAWYIFSAIGFYPVNPASGEFVFGRPLFDKAVINVDGGNKFVIETKNNSKTNRYISKIILNGKVYTKNTISYADIMKGGTLALIMSPVAKN